jgi:two-component system chemotaxis sensor kinase CheA
MIDVHKNAFVEEATELLSELETSLLDLEANPDDKEIIAKVFRALHTIKGSSGMFGYDDITMFTHDIETVYDYIRNGEIRITRIIIDLTLAARDQISAMLQTSDNNRSVDETATKEILTSFRNIVTEHKSKSNIKDELLIPIEKKVKEYAGDTSKTYRIIFKPSQEIFLTGTNPIILLNELKQLGDAIILSNFSGVPRLEDLNPEKCYAFWEIVLKTDKGIDAIKDVFIFVEDQCDLKIEIIDENEKLKKDEDFHDFEILIQNISKTKYPDIITLIQEFEHSSSSTVPQDYIISVKKGLSSNHDRHGENDSTSSIRVNSEKLDELVNLVGELVTVQARLTEISAGYSDPNLISVAEEVERITSSLRDSALNTRMLPIGTTFSKFKRLVRDLSKELDKKVELTTDGAETELDKTVIEKLNDPLIHIIRNSIDHGIETPAERECTGKNPVGIVCLSASQSGGNVLIKISDDGAGMDKDAIKDKAVKMGLISESSELSDSEIFSLIFAAGFSTAKKVTNVSGRGVGMDVVKRAIENLRGTVQVSSKKGVGTTISLKLPLTLAIIDGLLVKIEKDLFILPLSSIHECIELTQSDIDNNHGRHIINVRGKIIPYIILRERFNIKSECPQIQQVVVADMNGNRIGFVVDQVFGQHQTVLKSLGKFYKHVEGVSGATILGDGTVALILDIGKLIEKEELDEKILT